MASYPMPYGLDVSIRITTQGDTKFVDVLAPMYIRTEWRLSFCYSSTFSDAAILECPKIHTALCNAYGPD